MSTSRRSIPRTGAAVAALALAAALLWNPGCRRRGEEARHVILFVGDGMSLAAQVAASRYISGRDDGLAWQSFPHRTFSATWDVTAYDRNARRLMSAAYDPSRFEPRIGYDVGRGGDRPVFERGADVDERYFVALPPPGPGASVPFTSASGDSASTATALATGWKTDAGNIAWAPGDRPEGRLDTIAEEFREARRASIGIVSTVPFNHATPAAFVSHNPNRSCYYTGYRELDGPGIADEILLEVRPDVVIGAGHPGSDNADFDTRRGYVSRRLYNALLESPDYVFAERRAGVDGSQAVLDAADCAVDLERKLFGLFGDSGGSFATPMPDDCPGDPRVNRAAVEDPPLADATVAALRVLARNPRGFFLLVEQGDIDWAAHDNDFRRLIGGVWDLHEAVRAAVAFIDRPGDGIHRRNTAIVVISDHATGHLRLNPNRPLGRGDLPRQAERVAEPPEPESGKEGESAAQAAAARRAKGYVSPFIYPDDEVGFGTAGHTNELVPVAVRGPVHRSLRRLLGTWYPAPILDNTQVNVLLREFLGLPAESRPQPAASGGPPKRAAKRP